MGSIGRRKRIDKVLQGFGSALHRLETDEHHPVCRFVLY